MGRRAREGVRERTTPGERLDVGFDLLDEALDHGVAQMDPPEGLDPEERARWIVARLREEDG